MKRVGCITFHASHNYGSCLQAYALQEFIKEHFPSVDYKILNFRSDFQKDFYSIIPSSASPKHKLAILLNYFPLKKKFWLFEDFISNHLNLTKEFSEEHCREEDFCCDLYIAGGDQPWNIRCKDFFWIYYLPFVRKAKKISYAVSLGPKQLTFTESEKSRLQDYVNQYAALSLREPGSVEQLQALTTLPMVVHADPVLLLDKERWRRLVGKKTEKGKYLLLYILDYDTEAYQLAGRLAKHLGLKVIVTKPALKQDFFGHYTNRFATGPLEFLGYVYHADLVVSTSFHGCVFAAIFERPFVTINASRDNRKSQFLQHYGLEKAECTGCSVQEIAGRMAGIDFTRFKEQAAKDRAESFAYLSAWIQEAGT